jgi:hypothetical protein
MESRSSPGSLLLGARTIQEGGAFLSMTREEVELFCIDHLVMVDIVAGEECLIFDFMSVTTPGPGGQVTGIEAVMQVAHIILTDFKFEEDAFQRAKQGHYRINNNIINNNNNNNIIHNRVPRAVRQYCEGVGVSLRGGTDLQLAGRRYQVKPDLWMHRLLICVAYWLIDRD